MKKYFLLLFAVALASCTEPQPLTLNKFVNTSWTADDPIKSIIYGPGCTTSLIFLSEDKVQQVDYIPSGPFKGVKTEIGAYTYNGDRVFVYIGDQPIQARLTGNFLITTILIQGNPITYVKN